MHTELDTALFRCSIGNRSRQQKTQDRIFRGETRSNGRILNK